MTKKTQPTSKKISSSSRLNVGKTIVTDVKAVKVDEKNLLIPHIEIPNLSVEVVSSNVLRLVIPADGSYPANFLAVSLLYIIESIEFIYTIFTVLLLEKRDGVKLFVELVKENGASSPKELLDKSWLYTFLTSQGIVPLRVLSMSYGSPISMDLLGIGKILEIVRDTIKDITWRGKYEKKIAELELTDKRTKLKNDKVKSGTEIEMQKAQIAKIKLENEKIMIEILRDKIQLIKDSSNLKISEKEKKILISVLLNRLETFSKRPPESLSDGEYVFD